ncbi:MAG: GntR family transcriptional regulator [Pseudomonadota bacterium]
MTVSGDTTGLSVAERAYTRLRDDVFTGVLAPGARLKLDQLKATYGVSITTLREVLGRLVMQGFVEAEGNRGFAVAPVSRTELREVGELRILLENHALRLAFAAGDVDWEARVLAAHHRLKHSEAAVIAGDDSQRLRWKRDDIAFHQALISACGSATLMHTYAQVFDRYLRYQMLALTSRGEGTANDHATLMQQALDRDIEGAQSTLSRHVAVGIEHAIDAGTLPDA